MHGQDLLVGGGARGALVDAGDRVAVEIVEDGAQAARRLWVSRSGIVGQEQWIAEDQRVAHDSPSGSGGGAPPDRPAITPMPYFSSL